jgi:hypothetical protein
MRGITRERHCEHCRKQVHNLAAMTAREIEALAARSEGGICARMRRRADGSLVMLDTQPKSSGIAQVAATALLTIGAASAAAQSRPDAISDVDQSAGMAQLSGNLQSSGEAKPLEDTVISLWKEGALLTEVSPSADGRFSVVVAPGVYDVELRLGKNKTRLPAVTLIAGVQELPSVPLSTTVTIEAVSSGDSVTMGEMASVRTRYSFLYILRHPIQYAKHLKNKD